MISNAFPRRIKPLLLEFDYTIYSKNQLNQPKFKRIADDILKCIYNENEVPYRVENIVRKGEIACYKQFLLFSQCFPQLYIFSASKCGLCVVMG